MKQKVVSNLTKHLDGNDDTNMFDEAAHSRLRDPTPSKDLYRVSRSILSTLGTVHLQESNLTSKFGRLLFIRLFSRCRQKQ